MVCCTVSLGEKEVKLHLDHPDGGITEAKEGEAGGFRLDVSQPSLARKASQSGVKCLGKWRAAQGSRCPAQDRCPFGGTG